MKISKISINNFRCFELLDFEPNPHLNVLVGKNGSGKSALLSALKVAIGSFFLGIDSEHTQDTKINKEDIRYAVFSKNLEKITPCRIQTEGNFGGEVISWTRGLEKETKYAKTTRKDASILKNKVQEINKLVKNGSSSLRLPLLVSYSTDRLCDCRMFDFNELIGSRFRGYAFAIDSSFSFEFEDWFYEKELSAIQSAQLGDTTETLELESIKKTIAQFIPTCETLYTEIRTKKFIIVAKDGSRRTFDSLSDGFKNMLRMITDMVIRERILNPDGIFDSSKIEGIVLIDEVDLHLHPSWQRDVVPSLLKAFPNVQFFVTTHSPMVLAGLEPFVKQDAPNIFLLNDDKGKYSIAPLQNDFLGSADNWLHEVFGLEEPRSTDAEVALIEAKKMLQIDMPDRKKLEKIHQKLLDSVQPHDLFWIRWNYFMFQNNVEI